MNCLGRLSRDSGHMRVPDPPHMITGLILGIHSPGWRVAIAIATRELLCNNGGAKAMLRSEAVDRHPLLGSRRARPMYAMIDTVAAS